jgi:hypothetical protein
LNNENKSNGPNEEVKDEDGFCMNNLTKHKMKAFRMCCFIKKYLA